MFIIILSQITFIAVAASQAKEWGLDKWRDQFLLSENVLKITLGKLIAYLELFMVYAIITFMILSPFYNVNYYGSILDKLIIAFFGIAASAAFGLFVGTFFKHRITVFLILGFTSYPFFMLSGFAWPQGQLLELVKISSYLLPLVPFLQAIIKVTQMQNSLYYASLDIVIMILQTIIYSTLFYLRITKIKRRRLPKTKLGKYIAGFVK